MYYHIIIWQKSSKSHDEVKLDLTKDEVITRFIEPYENGESLFINGKSVQLNDFESEKQHEHCARQNINIKNGAAAC